MNAPLRLVARVSPTLARISHATPKSITTWVEVLPSSDTFCACCGHVIRAMSKAFAPTSRSKLVKDLRLHAACVDRLGPAKIVYYLRGTVERIRKGGRRSCATYRGYSAQGPRGPLQPWMTRPECVADARRQGATASFSKDAPP